VVLITQRLSNVIEMQYVIRLLVCARDAQTHITSAEGFPTTSGGEYYRRLKRQAHVNRGFMLYNNKSDKDMSIWDCMLLKDDLTN
jgi:hypothetical protein